MCNLLNITTLTSLLHLSTVTSKVNSDNSIPLDLNLFHPSKIPGIKAHNDLQRYMYITLENKTESIGKIKTFYINFYKVDSDQDASNRNKNSGTSTSNNKPKDLSGVKYTVNISEREGKFKAERNDCELSLQYFNGPITNVELTDKKQEEPLKNNSKNLNISGNNCLIVASEWFNWFRMGKTSNFFQIIITDENNKVFKSKYFEVCNSLEKKVDSAGKVTYENTEIFPVSDDGIKTFEYSIQYLDNQKRCDTFIDKREDVFNSTIGTLKTNIKIYCIILLISVAVPLGATMFLNRKGDLSDEDLESEDLDEEGEAVIEENQVV